MNATFLVVVFRMLCTLLLVASIFSSGAELKKVALPDLAVNTWALVCEIQAGKKTSRKKIFLIGMYEKQTYGIFGEIVREIEKKVMNPVKE